MKKTIAIVIFALTGCASTDSALMRESAIAIGGSTTPDNVQLLNVERGLTTVGWDAVTPDGAYTCNGDDMLKHVRCTLRHK